MVALFSRLVLIALSILSNALLPDHEASGVYLFAPNDLTSPLLTTFTRWDAAYFLQIAHDQGYAQLPFHAFFPLFPWCIRGLALLIEGPTPSSPTLIIAGLLTSNMSFTWAALMLFNLSLAVHGHVRFAYLSSLIFCLSPANIFFTTVYSESLYAATTFTALYLWLTRRYLWALPCFMAASACRSNGLVNMAFIAVNLLRHSPVLILAHPPAKAPNKPARWRWTLSTNLVPHFLYECFMAALGAVAIASPYIAVQYYGYLKYCTGKGGLLVPDEELIWCQRSLPNIYSFIQEHYWGVGPFRYYQLKQIPNFLLAAPVLLLSLAGTWCYARSLAVHLTSLLQPNTDTSHRTSQEATSSSELLACYLSPVSVGLQVTWAILTVFAIVVAHIQISTRLIGSSCPPLYWYMALVLAYPQKPWHRKALVVYLGTFNLLGVLMHPNFLPWT